jgi:hypothetical protein
MSAALEQLKDIILANIPAGKIEAHAFRLLGESQETIDREAHDLFEALRGDFPQHTAFGLSLALRELICDRVREIESTGRGNA